MSIKTSTLMSNILAIDSSSKGCAVCIRTESHTLTRKSEDQRAAAQSLLPYIDELVVEAGIQLKELNLIAVAAGPGSFTGIRIGIGIAQGLGESLQIPVLPVSSLSLLAWEAAGLSEARYVSAALFARAEEFYFANLEVSPNEGVTVLAAETVADLTDFNVSNGIPVGAAPWVVAGDAWDKIPGLGDAAGELPRQLAQGATSVTALAELAFLHHQKGTYDDHLPLPNYVKEQLDYS